MSISQPKLSSENFDDDNDDDKNNNNNNIWNIDMQNVVPSNVLPE